MSFSQRFSKFNKNIILSPTMMSFKEYYMSYSENQFTHLANGWGWFVDIESNLGLKPILKYSRFNVKPSQHLNIPPTINEHSTIRSRESIDNLTLIFEMDDIEEDHKYKINRNFNKMIYCNTIVILTIALIYYTLYII